MEQRRERPSGTGRLTAPLALLALVGLFAATAALSTWHHAERDARARAHVAEGRAHAASGRLPLAVEEYRAALLLQPGDFEAERALALVLLDLGRVEEAEAYLTELLQRDPVSGPLNLGLARVRAAQPEDADSRRLYQRAIYGEWPDDSGGRVMARFELVEYLFAHGRRDEVLAELLRLKADVAADDLGRQRRLASLLTRAGAPDAAVDVLAAAADHEPRDSDLLTQLAEAQLQSGRPADARRTLRRAIAADPERPDIRDRLTVVDRVLTLDPTLPNLRLAARTRRARALTAAVVEQTARCDGDAALRAMRGAVRARQQRRRSATSETADEDLASAVRLWTAAADCRATGPEAEAVGEIVGRIARATEEPQP